MQLRYGAGPRPRTPEGLQHSVKAVHGLDAGPITNMRRLNERTCWCQGKPLASCSKGLSIDVSGRPPACHA
jgi:hypothetical protein